MLRSKNLKKVLEQSLTKDFLVCAVFNADGVVLAHATSPEGVSIGNRANSRRSSSLATETGSPSRHHSALGARNGHDFNTSERVSSHGSDNWLQSQGTARNGTEGAKKPEPSTSQIISHKTSQALSIAAAGSSSRYLEDNLYEDSLASSFCDINGDGLASTSARERLDDDLAIAASLWQNYEHLPNLIERKDRDIDEYIGDDGSEVQDDMFSNSLQLVIIECEYGKAAVSRLGNYRLFLLSKPDMPLGMLKLKSENLCRYLEECLHLTTH
ncbi:hypothetical protein LPJ78_000248 [Coemansia sp. RSA 989]|nr:hypothetical protein BX667DRAFT_502319 [Coemansia mojavensis]KAJ1743567.1 hypothetical protein LPJ68_000832 [Coemansia sp. RSA 1086]KAJ1752724.1 hypothetical protein LPJ79_000980 [Coemansia sp. RSA 1821]KAJ1868310.1 hypothetical protein LPJ78_000248 [Coemansia sp. RSA 989]KAJ1875578.1 hypothetical protein LPJ55_000571 [Coemansia sp. RSA 990]KAJ2633077.1 hypothetical protein H4R22_000756 [Coemansia sp. RSA 1290]KAJ2650465.1 hypothetical protein IWW40_002428 [Coemansia sp. RSA 1250]KAJ26731